MTSNKAGKVFAAIAALPRKEVLVGIPEDKAARRDDPLAPSTGPMTNAVLGYIHENGAPEANIPARPFLIPGVHAVQSETIKMFKVAGAAALAGDAGKMDKVLHVIGLTNQASVRNALQTGAFVPLSPVTIAARLRRGRTGTRPLIDTGQLRNSINYVVRSV